MTGAMLFLSGVRYGQIQKNSDKVVSFLEIRRDVVAAKSVKATKNPQLY